MLEVVFGDSAKGSLVLAQHYGAGAYHSGCIGIIGCHEDGSPFTEAERQAALEEAEAREQAAWEQAVPLGGQPSDVFDFSLVLSMGDIREEDFYRRRQEAIDRLYSIYPAQETEERFSSLSEQAGQALSALRTRFQAGEPLRVWYSHQPEERCGLCWLMAELTPWKLPQSQVLLVQLPPWEEQEDGILTEFTSWGEIGPGDWHRFLPLARLASPVLCRSLAGRWRDLQAENAPLRGMLNGQLVSLPEDVYDSFLLRELTRQPEVFHEARLIGDMLGRYPLGIGDCWIALRIERLIDRGLLEPVTQPEPGDALYRRMLRKCVDL